MDTFITYQLLVFWLYDGDTSTSQFTNCDNEGCMIEFPMSKTTHHIVHEFSRINVLNLSSHGQVDDGWS